MNNAISGIQYLLSGFQLISKPGIRRFVIIPLIINITVFTALFFIFNYFIKEFNLWFAHFLPSWLQWLSSIIWLVFFAGFFVMILYTFVTLANIISAPFNSFLAEKVEFYLTGKVFEDRSLWDNIKDIPRIVGRQISIIFYYLPRALLILLLFFVPMVQAIAALVSFLFHAWLMTLTYLDYPTDNHRVAMSKVRAWSHQRRWVSLGFGVSVLIFSMIPIINFFTIPAAVAGATKLWVDENNKFKQ